MSPQHDRGAEQPEPEPATPPTPTKKYTIEESEELGHHIVLLRKLIMSLDRDHLEQAAKNARKIVDNDDAIGCLLKPEGYSVRREVMTINARRLELLVEFIDQELKLAGANFQAAHEERQRAEALRALGIS